MSTKINLRTGQGRDRVRRSISGMRSILPARTGGQMADLSPSRRLLKAYGLGTALTLILASFATADRAEAACVQTGETVDCTGANGPQISTDPGIVYHLESGATVGSIGVTAGTVTVDENAGVSNGIGGGIGLLTVNNAGAIAGSSSAVQSKGELTLNNIGSIAASGGDGVSAHRAAIGNSGTILGATSGIAADGETLTVTNSGTVQATATGGSGIAYNPAGSSTTLTIHNAAAGFITGGVGINVGGPNAANAVLTLDNVGTISATSLGGVGIKSSGTVNITGNTGTITGRDFGILTTGDATVQNAGTISSGDGRAISATDLNLVNASGGQISGLVSGLFVVDLVLNNAGTISAAQEAITTSDATIANSGSIQSQGTGIDVGSLDLRANSGTISGGAFGISARATANVNNTGGLIEATDANGVAISGATVNVTGNTGTIRALGTSGIAIDGTTVNVTNNLGGTIAGDTVGVRATDTATVVNSGTITGIAPGSLGIIATTLVLKNTGTVQGDGSGVAQEGGSANITNSGTIAGVGTGSSGIAATSLVLTNTGTVQGNGLGIDVDSGSANITNSGMITGRVAMTFGAASTVTNSGSIVSTDGPTGTAIRFSSAADTLNILPGSRIIGMIDMGHGADVINVTAPPPPPTRGISTLTLSLSGMIDSLKKQLVNFDGVLNAIGGMFSPAAGQAAVTSGAMVASLDPTALAQQDRTLIDFSGGVSSMVQGRLGGSSAAASNVQMMSYAMEEPAGASGTAGDQASREARAEMFSKAPAATWSAAPVTVWSSAVGGVRNQSGTDTTLNSTSSSFAGLIGIDRRITPDWLVGVFAGGGTGRLGVALNSQTVDTDYVFGGGYSRFAWNSQFVDLTLQAGGLNNRSTRHVQNNITGGLESANANYSGWYLSPDIAYGYHFDVGNGYILTPTARLRYVAGFFDGYNETGSTQTLSIGSRTLQDLEERAELEVSRMTTVFGDHPLKTTLHGGAIALQRVGDATVSAVLVGQGLTFVTPGNRTATGVVAGASFDYHASTNVALFGAVEGIAMSDQSRTGSGRAGVRVAF